MDYHLKRRRACSSPFFFFNLMILLEFDFLYCLLAYWLISLSLNDYCQLPIAHCTLLSRFSASQRAGSKLRFDTPLALPLRMLCIWRDLRCASTCPYALCPPAANAAHLAGSLLRFDMPLAPCPLLLHAPHKRLGIQR